MKGIKIIFDYYYLSFLCSTYDLLNFLFILSCLLIQCKCECWLYIWYWVDYDFPLIKQAYLRTLPGVGVYKV